MPKILIVDDEAIVHQVLSRLIENDCPEWKVRFALSGHEALSILEKDSFDVLVTDLNMNRMTGAELLKEAKTLYPEMPRIAFSGSSDKHLLARATTLTHEQVAKPYKFADLKSAILRCLELKSKLDDGETVDKFSSLENLPSPPHLYKQLVDSLKDEQVEPSLVGGIVATDPAMASKILHIVNTPYFSVDWKITDIEEAVSKLGYDTLKALVTAEEVFSTFQADEAAQSLLARLQNEGLNTAIIARELATLADGNVARANAAYVCGLLANVGKIVFLSADTAAYLEIAFQNPSSESIDQAEDASFGLTHAELGAKLLKEWGFENEIVYAVANHSQPQADKDSSLSLSMICHLAEAIASQDDLWRSRIDWSQLKSCGVTAEKVEDWNKSIQERLAA